MKKVALILSGCGVYDGAEIHESVLTLLALDQAGVTAECFAPDIPQHHVINHITGKEVSEPRNVMTEASRICRGKIKPLSEFTPAPYLALILPGGFGAAKNLSNFAFKDAKMTIDPSVEYAVVSTHAAHKPMGFICIAPAIAAKIFGPKGVRFTIGNDAKTAKTLESWGGTHVCCDVSETVVDANLKIVSTPAYMLAQRISEAEIGINRLVADLLAMA